MAAQRQIERIDVRIATMRGRCNRATRTGSLLSLSLQLKTIVGIKCMYVRYIEMKRRKLVRLYQDLRPAR